MLKRVLKIIFHTRDLGCKLPTHMTLIPPPTACPAGLRGGLQGDGAGGGESVGKGEVL